MAEGVAFVHTERAKEAGIYLDNLIPMPYEAISPRKLWNSSLRQGKDYQIFYKSLDEKEWQKTIAQDLFRKFEADKDYTRVPLFWGN